MGNNNVIPGRAPRAVIPMSKATSEDELLGKEAKKLRREALRSEEKEKINAANEIKMNELSDRGLVGKRAPFNVSEVLEDPPMDEIETKTEVYVPAAFARERLQAVLDEMHRMKDANFLTLAQVEDSFSNVHMETKTRYESFLHDLQTRALNCIENYKKALGRSRSAMEQKETQHRMAQEQLQKQIEDFRSRLIEEQHRKSHSDVVQHFESGGLLRVVTNAELLAKRNSNRLAEYLHLEHKRHDIAMDDKLQQEQIEAEIEDILFRHQEQEEEVANEVKMKEKEEIPLELKKEENEQSPSVKQQEDEKDQETQEEEMKQDFPMEQQDETLPDTDLPAEEIRPYEKERNSKIPEELLLKLEEQDKIIAKLTNALEEKMAASIDGNGDGSAASNKRFLEKMKATEKKLKESEKQVKEFRNKSNRLEQELEKAQILVNSSETSTNGSGGNVAKLKKELDELKKKQKKQMEETEKQNQKIIRALESKLQDAELQANKTEEELSTMKEKFMILESKAKKVDELEKANGDLANKAQELDSLRETVQSLNAQTDELEEMYKKEQKMRKEYWNMMEDMKGKIRVFARCRPMAKYELERNCGQVIQFPDEFTLNVDSNKGSKQFLYDRCFTPCSTQDEVFEDTRNLIQSALDGYNVCVFAYGQTGSGKTFTMVGSEEHPGLVRRSVAEVFKYKEEHKKTHDLTVKLYVLELYLDQLVDLMYSVLKKADKSLVPKEPPRLDIKKDKKGTVFVKGAQVVTVESVEELLNFFDKANDARHVASTKMNAGSSRSHLVFSLLLENTDKASKKTSTGKLSLVDLAGSERQDKTGATDERLKEAMSINKSLSALGDVISALSTGEKFVPYRNNVLTQLMSDSLGGNAKTLMFVNISPADYNVDETTSSLIYASRVKNITNKADKSQNGEEIMQLKKIIKELKEGKTDLLEAAGLDLD